MIRCCLVIPCYNEREGIPTLLDALAQMRQALSPEYVWDVVFVNDGSVDGTRELLETACLTVPGTRVVHHASNRGLGAALRTGFEHVTGDLIATIDSDCTYDPREMGAMLALVHQGADVVVASPYHPQGGVDNVPKYRLFLSRNLSRLYCMVIGANLYTYTSLFRIYRAEVLRAVRFDSDGFLSMAQILVGALLAGFSVVEHPTRLSVREYGESKAAILRLTMAHIKYLCQLARKRARIPKPTRIQAARPLAGDIVEWNREMNRSHGMSVLEKHPNFLVRLHERGRKRRIWDMIRASPADVVVDVGCEQGSVSAHLAGSCRYLVCVDIDHDVVLAARAKLDGRRTGFVVADAQHLPLRNESSDVTISTHTLEHLPDPVQGLRELVRITRPAGKLVINVPNDRWMLVLKRFVFGTLRLRRLFRGINPGLAPGHLWVFHRGLLREICRGLASFEQFTYNPPFFTNMFAVARPLDPRRGIRALVQDAPRPPQP